MAGRGVDILLGGNPEGLAAQEVVGRGPRSRRPTRARPATHELLPKYEAECKAEGDKVRELGGLYVLGTERHESRRIDNQLRGRSGRQGDPGESRFYLSLEDELMRLFATGAMNWVMGKALPDDVPIEAKMVTKAIERAQNTVEPRNAEIRKDVLKYDEVMNEQRKVIYSAGAARSSRARTSASETLEVLAERRRDASSSRTAPTDFAEEWDLDGLVTEVTQLLPDRVHRRGAGRGRHRPTRSTRASLAEAIGYYERARGVDARRRGDRCAQLEREVMLQIIDQQWREHLSEMDYLREGINLRAMGQQDPLVAWQREGFEMFGQMMSGIDDDYVDTSCTPRSRCSSRPSSRRGGRAGPGPVRGRRRPGAGQRRRASGPWRPGRRRARRSCWRRRPAARQRLGGPAVVADAGRGRRPGADREGLGVRPGRPQRPVLVRQRQEVQVLPRRN